MLYSNLIIISLYSSPRGDLEIFQNKLEEILLTFVKKKAKIVICGDFNIEMCIENTINTKLKNMPRTLGFFIRILDQQD